MRNRYHDFGKYAGEQYLGTNFATANNIQVHMCGTFASESDRNYKITKRARACTTYPHMHALTHTN